MLIYGCKTIFYMKESEIHPPNFLMGLEVCNILCKDRIKDWMTSDSFPQLCVKHCQLYTEHFFHLAMYYICLFVSDILWFLTYSLHIQKVANSQVILKNYKHLHYHNCMGKSVIPNISSPLLYLNLYSTQREDTVADSS